MKKIFLFQLVLMVCVGLAACGDSGDYSGGNDGKESRVQETEAPGNEEKQDAAKERTDPAEEYEAQGDAETARNAEPAAADAAAELKAPVMNWWELYNPNGFDTLTAELYNPNDIAVDVCYDLVYCKDGTEVARSEYFASFSMLPGQKALVWANDGIPKKEDADTIRMENVTVTEAAYPPVNGTYEDLGVTDGKRFFEFTFDETPTLANIMFLLYSDSNGNGQFDKGEIVVTSTAALTEQIGTVSFETEVYAYTDYIVYFTAY